MKISQEEYTERCLLLSGLTDKAQSMSRMGSLERKTFLTFPYESIRDDILEGETNPSRVGEEFFIHIMKVRDLPLFMAHKWSFMSSGKIYSERFKL